GTVSRGGQTAARWMGDPERFQVLHSQAAKPSAIAAPARRIHSTGAEAFAPATCRVTEGPGPASVGLKLGRFVVVATPIRGSPVISRTAATTSVSAAAAVNAM